MGLLLERVVPLGGAIIAGIYLAEGTVLGISPWVAAGGKDVYGREVYQFRPERWLEANAKQLRLMERNSIAFSEGTGTCLGKNISMLEMSKLVPQVLRRSDFELVQPRMEWRMDCFWSVNQTGLVCRVRGGRSRQDDG